MKKLKNFLTRWTELYFMVLFISWTIYVYLDDLSLIHYPAIVAIIVLGILLLTKNRVFGLCTSALLGIVSFYLIFALVSDLRHMVAFDKRALSFLLQGGLLIIGNLTMSTLMFLKYLRTDKNQNPVTARY